jgi:hypothetical protein
VRRGRGLASREPKFRNAQTPRSAPGARVETKPEGIRNAGPSRTATSREIVRAAADQRADEPTATDEGDFPDHTEAPGSYIPIYQLALDSTSAPEIGQSERIQGEFAASPSALVDKYFLSQLRRGAIVHMIPLALILWIFVQDNGAGRLQNWAGIWWCLQKCGIALSLCTISFIIATITQRRRAD